MLRRSSMPHAALYVPVPAGGAWTPDDITADAWHQASDADTRWEVDDGTSPAGLGDTVGRWDDKSGNGNHWVQASGGLRPVVAQDGSGNWEIVNDGISDFMAMATTALGTTISDLVVGIAYREITRQNGHLFACGHPTEVAKLWSLTGPYGDGNYYFDVGGTSAPNRISEASPVAAGNNLTLVAICNTTNGEQILRVNGSVIASDATGHSITGIANAPRLWLNNTLTNHAAIHATVLKVGVLTSQEISDLETWLAAQN